MPHRRLLFHVAAVAFSTAAYQYWVAQELALILHEAWLAVVTRFFCAYLCLGLGSYCAQRLKDKVSYQSHGRLIAGAIGFPVLISLGTFLRLSPTNLPCLWGIAAAASLLSCLTLLGYLYGSIMLAVAQENKGCLGIASACAVLGYGAGFLAAIRLGPWLGVNAALLLFGLSSLLIPLLNRYAVILILCSLPLIPQRLDMALERLRPVIVITNISSTLAPPVITEKYYTNVWSKWSPYAKVDIYKSRQSNHLVGAYNYRGLWNWSSNDFLERCFYRTLRVKPVPEKKRTRIGI